MGSPPFKSFAFGIAVLVAAFSGAAGAEPVAVSASFPNVTSALARGRPTRSPQPQRPPPDRNAMGEVLAAGREQPEPYLSARSVEHYIRAMLARHSGDVVSTLADLRLAALYDPRAVFPRYALGLEFHRQGHSDAAERAVRDALELKPDHAPSLVLLARLELRRGEVDEGRALLERAAEADSLAPEPLRRLIPVLLEMDALEEAVTVAGRLDALPHDALGGSLRRFNEDVADAFTDVALALSDAGRDEEALILLRRALERDPADDSRTWALARLLTELDRHAESADVLERLARTDPLARAEVLRLRLAAGQLERARAELKALVARLRGDEAGDSDRAMRALELAGSALLRSGLAGDAVPLVHEALNRHPDRVELLYLSGAAHEAMGDCDAATAAYVQVPDEHGLSPAARARALACSPVSLLSLAVRESLSSLVEAHPEDPEVLDSAARAWIEKSRVDGSDVDALIRARRYAQLAVNARPFDVRFLVTFADALLLSGREEEALETLRRASSFDAGGRSAVRLSELLLRLGRTEEARAAVLRASTTSEAERDPRMRAALGRVMRELPAAADTADGPVP